MVIEIYNGVRYDCSDIYSNTNMNGWDLSNRTDMNGINIHGLCLSHETPNAQTLPSDLTGTTFILCNLDNVFIPAGNTIINCSIRRFSIQNDGQDWIIDNDGNPIEPLNIPLAIAMGLNTDPTKIPQD